MLRTRAGVALAVVPETDRPAAQRMPARMSLSVPPHLPSTRTGRTNEFQDMPVMPAELFDRAPIIPETRVPCHELAEVRQLVKMRLFRSASVIQSPGSLGSESRPSLSLACAVPETKSKPGRSFP